MTGKSDFEAWAEEIRALLSELAKLDLGYPMDAHEVMPPATMEHPVTEHLHPMYAAFGAVSMPDVHVGYFIHPADRVASGPERGAPIRIVGESTRAIQVFGSDGGGNLFAVDVDSGAVYYLPLSGAGLDGEYHEDDLVRARRIAGSVVEFLERLKADVRAFVHGDPLHEYLDPWP